MRGSTVALAVIAVIAVGALFFSWQGDSSDRPDSGRLGAAPAERPGKAQNRLDDLRNAYDRGNQAADSDGSLEQRAAGAGRQGRPAMRREVPTRGAVVAQEGTIDDLPYDEDDVEEVDEYRNVILDDPDPDERVGAILMLSGNEHPEAIATFVRALDDEDAEVRLAAVEALGDYIETIEPTSLARVIDDPDPEVRFEAISILGDFETPAAYDLVRQALDDPDEDIRELAEGILEDAEEQG
jgi:hypothetical protein